MIAGVTVSGQRVLELPPSQLAVISADESNFLIGPAGSGKSTALFHRLHRLLESGEQAYTILVLVSETGHIPQFTDAVRDPDREAAQCISGSLRQRRNQHEQGFRLLWRI